MIRLIVSGCCGKMGRRIISLASSDDDFKLQGAIEDRGHPAKGKRLSEALMIPALSDIQITDSAEVVKDGDALIEFTNPAATVEHLDAIVKYKKAAVIGTTGLTAEQVAEIKQASAQVPIVFSPNMSLGVNLFFSLAKEAARKLGPGYRADIIETHHVHKKDTPSGTAKHLAEIIAQNSEEKSDQVNIQSIREGEIVGDHQVRFCSPQDIILIKHSAKTRDIFVHGALAATKFVVQQSPGLYDMQDVIEGK